MEYQGWTNKEAHKMETTTKKQLKQYEEIYSVSLHINGDWNVDTGKREYQLTDKQLLKIVRGPKNIVGALFQFTNRLTGKKLELAAIDRTWYLRELLEGVN